MCSRPTDSRTRPGVHAGNGLLFRRELAVRGRRRVDDQRAHVTDVGHVGVQLQGIDKALAGLRSPGDVEGHDGAGPLGTVLAAALVPGAGRQPRVGDRFDVVPGFEPFGHLGGVGDVPLHAQAQGLDALGDEEGVERGDRRAEVAQQLDAGLEDVGEVGAEGAVLARGRGRRPGRCRWGPGC